MARAIRVQYLGACKHVMARGNGGGIKWISEKLMMGHLGSVSRLIERIAKDSELEKRLGALEKMLKCED